MHQEASEEGVHLCSPRAPWETLKRGLCSLQNDRALAFAARLPGEGICTENDSVCSMTIQGGGKGLLSPPLREKPLLQCRADLELLALMSSVTPTGEANHESTGDHICRCRSCLRIDCGPLLVSVEHCG
jgi:hypothetical protein